MRKKRTSTTPEVPEPIISETPPVSLVQRYFYWALYVVIGVALATGLLFLFWGLQDPEVLKVNHGSKKQPTYPFVVRPDSNSPGQVEYVKVDYCKTDEARGTVVARMVGKKSIIRIPWPVESSPKQCLDTEIPIVVPTYATNDEYYFDFTITYDVNPIKKKIVYLRSQSFKIQSVPIVQ